MTSLVLTGCSLTRTVRAISIAVFIAYFSLSTSLVIARESPIFLVANPDVTINLLNRDTVRAIFAMRQRTWPNGQAARVFVLDSNNAVHARFTKEHLSVYPHQLQLAWDRMVFSGTGQAPDRVSNQVEMRDRIASTPGAIGYIEREYLDDSVQVISIE